MSLEPLLDPSEPPAVHPLDRLRAIAAEQGVHPTDADLELVRGYVDRLLPALAELERRLPPDAPL